MRSGLLNFTWSHLKQTWSRKWLTNFFIFWVLFASFTVLDSVLLLSMNFSTLTRSWGNKVEMNVYLDGENQADETARRELRASMEGHPLVENIRFVSRQAAVTDLQRQLGDSAPDLLGDKELLEMIPESFQLELRAGSPAMNILPEIEGFVGELKKHRLVGDVQYGQGLLERFQTVISVFKRIGSVSLVALIMGSLFMVLFMVRNSLESRRDEIEILELVGASRSMVRVPFIVEGVLFSAAAGLASLWASSALFEQLRKALGREEIFVYVAHRLNFFSSKEIFLLALAHLGVGALASLICVTRLNTGFAAAEKLNGGLE